MVMSSLMGLTTQNNEPPVRRVQRSPSVKHCRKFYSKNMVGKALSTGGQAARTSTKQIRTEALAWILHEAHEGG